MKQTKNRRKNPPLDILGGTKQPTKVNRYLAKNGLYYNGYIGSSDCADDYFTDAVLKIAEALKKELKEG